MDPRHHIALLLKEVLDIQGLGSETTSLYDLIEVPRDRAHGDFAFPCFTLAKELRQAPPRIAQSLSEKCTPQLLASYPMVASLEPIGPYLNFRINVGELAQYLIPAILEGTYLAIRPATKQRVMVEYSQPNTHKAFHVGHCRSASLGDSLARIFGWLGSDVIPVNYLGDEGTHVAKCLWRLQQYPEADIPSTNKGEFLGRLYTEATELLDLSRYTTLPFPGIIVARVLATTPHPEEAGWSVVTIDIGTARKQVVSGGAGFSVGDCVAYAPPGSRLAGRTVGVLDKKGVPSEGMICSEKELEVSEANEKILLLPRDTELGLEIAEVGRIPDLLPADASVLEVLRQREQEVSEVLQRLEGGDAKIKDLWHRTKQWSLDEYHDIYRWLDCHFVHDFFESDFGESSKELVRDFVAKGTFIHSEGAIGADLSPYGLGFCLLIKRDGTALYATRDLALARRKFEDFHVDRSIYVVDSAQTLHFQQVFKCLELMGYERAKDCYHVAFAQVVRPDGKMSSRKGNVVLFSDLVSRLVTKITAEFLDNFKSEWSQEEITTTANLIARATVRYGMLSQDNNSLVVFDLDEWTARSGNTGPYMLYACARIKSILREAAQMDVPAPQWSLLSDPSEADLLLHLLEYPRVVARAGDTYSPHLIATYVYELSKLFSRFYHDCSVLHADSPALRASRLGLAKGVLAALTHGLGLLGITTVERM